MRRLALFLDGTWNKPQDNTNVWRLYTLVARESSSGIAQVTYYDAGVGTRWHDRFRGGAFGTGLTGKVREAYEWLVANYEPEDQIFIFGFSRGAFTARSLAGLIARAGILLPGSTTSVADVFDHYRSESTRHLDEATRPGVELIGVFDTVGALGVPGVSRRRYRFLNPNPSAAYRSMYHALAVNENRKPYRCTFWTKWAPSDFRPDELKRDQVLEQRWFVGAHSNVGGGYRHDDLAAVPLAWMQERALSHGLEFKRLVEPAESCHLAPIADSFGSFLGGFYPLTRLLRRYWRPIGATGSKAVRRDNRQDGRSFEVNQVVDASVFDRMRADASYRPKNIRRLIDAGSVDLEHTGDLKTGTWI